MDEYVEPRCENLLRFALNAPQLTSAHIWNSIPRPSSPFENLLSLGLHFDSPLLPLDMARVADMLGNTPRLEWFKMSEDLDWDCLRAMEDLHRIHLPHLDTLSLTLKNSLKIAHLLKSVDAPKLAASSLRPQTINSPLASLLAPLKIICTTLSFMELFVSSEYLMLAPIDAQELRDTLDERDFDDHNPAEGPVAFSLFQPDVDARVYAECLDGLLAHMGSSLDRIRRCVISAPNSSDTVSTKSEDMLSKAFSSFGRALTAATQLHLNSDTESLVFLRALAGRSPMVFPALQTLRFSCDGDSAPTRKALKTLLALRSTMKAPIERLELAGPKRSCARGLHAFPDVWVDTVEQCRKAGHVKDVKDDRYEGSCDKCRLGRYSYY
ncbi:hypothetical protein PENSPDRAFT_659590 [Peniophora sp. CONT]|nr:hypothetical protein PENSPDRAFT_659590 [Peniophora sp. CONT]